MLRNDTHTLPQSLLSYVAFRVALRETVELLVALGPGWYPDDTSMPAGYLSEVSLLRGTSLAVQLDLLAETWDRHVAPEKFPTSLIDESVLYAACEYTAMLAEHSASRVTWALRGGPIDVTVPVDRDLASELRRLYLNLSSDGDFLLASQFLDIPPDDAAPLKRQLSLNVEQVELLYDVLGRWHPSPDLVGNLRHLVTVSEARQIAELLKVPCPAI